MAAIFFVSSLPEAPLPQDASDKSAHALAYLGLTVFVVRALAGGLPARIGWRMAAGAILIAGGYGALDELHQMFVPGRSAELYDVYADAIGAVAATTACWVWGIITLRSPIEGRAP